MQAAREYLQIMCVCEKSSRFLNDCVSVARFTVSGHFSYIYTCLIAEYGFRIK
jgi:hypothetical protein